MRRQALLAVVLASAVSFLLGALLSGGVPPMPAVALSGQAQVRPPAARPAKSIVPLPGAVNFADVAERINAAVVNIDAATRAGHGRRIVFLPVLALGLWLVTVGQGCVRDLASQGAAGWFIGAHWPCLVATLVVGAGPVAALVLMLRRGAPLAPRLTAVLGGIAAAGLANFVVRFVHAADASVIVLVWHLGAVGIVIGTATASGHRLFQWPRMP